MKNTKIQGQKCHNACEYSDSMEHCWKSVEIKTGESIH